MPNVFLSIPVLGRPELRMMYSTYRAILASKMAKIRIYFNENDSLISRVRNVHISTFYYDFPECDYFMSIDSDIEILNCHPNNNIFDKFISHNVDFVGGLYAIKKPGTKRCSSICSNGLPPQFNQGLREMRWLSSGCWCIKREVIDKMIKAYPELTYDGDDNATGKKIHGLYIPMIYDVKENDFPNVKLPFRKYLSEDWSMAQRWLDIGGKIYADTSIVLKHIGTVDYNLWDVEMVVQKKPEIPQPGFDLKPKNNNE